MDCSEGHWQDLENTHAPTAYAVTFLFFSHSFSTKYAHSDTPMMTNDDKNPSASLRSVCKWEALKGGKSDAARLGEAGAAASDPGDVAAEEAAGAGASEFEGLVKI